MRRLLPLLIAGCVGTFGEPPDAGAPDAGAPGPDAGSGSDAGTMDAGVRDGGTDAGVPDAGASDAGATCTAAFCEDFERYDGGIPKGPWSVSTNSGSIAMDPTKSHSGSRSVHVTNAGANSYEQAYISMTGPFFPVPDYWGRVWMYVTAVPSQTTHWTNIQGEGPVLDAGNNSRASVRYGGQYSPTMMANYDTSNAATDCWQHSMFHMPAGRWACYEWRYQHSENHMELWVDGTNIGDNVDGGGMGCIGNDLNGKWILPVFDTLRLGWEHYQTSDPIDLWVDDVALDTQRIGCN
jgi:hypothetical protein